MAFLITSNIWLFQVKSLAQARIQDFKTGGEFLQ